MTAESSQIRQDDLPLDWPHQAVHACYGRYNWRRWRLMGWFEMWAYSMGLVSGGCTASCCNLDCPGHPEWGWLHTVRLDLKRRPYILGWLRDEPRWMHWLRNGHWPNFYLFSGDLFKPTSCGICAPMPCCGSVNYDCKPGCMG